MTESQPQTPLANYRLTLAYDGRAYYGWQRHGDKPTLQGRLEQAIHDCFDVQSLVQGSGRTDRGAHALGQVASVSLPADLDPRAALAALAAHMPDDFQVLALSPAGPDFHAREAAVSKTYRYRIWNHARCPEAERDRVWHLPTRLDIEAMRAACLVFVGRHDFGSFAKKPNYVRASTTRTIMAMTLAHDDATPALIEISMRADAFLYKMVRNIVRAIVKVGEGRTPLAELPEILAACDRRAAPGTAPASGLYLDSVDYE